MDPARKKNVDDSGFPEDTRQTTRVVCLTGAAIRSLKDNDRHLWAIWFRWFCHIRWKLHRYPCTCGLICLRTQQAFWRRCRETVAVLESNQVRPSFLFHFYHLFIFTFLPIPSQTSYTPKSSKGRRNSTLGNPFQWRFWEEHKLPAS
jgi:hypothetical protein